MMNINFWNFNKGIIAMKNKDYIHRVPLFNDLSNEGKEYLKSLLHHKTFNKGDLIFSPNSQDELIIVVLGQLKVYKLNKDEKNILSELSALEIMVEKIICLIWKIHQFMGLL